MIQTLQRLDDQTWAEINEEMAIRRTREIILLYTMGSQTDHLIKQKVEKQGVFCVVADPASFRAESVAALKPIGIIISGGPASVHSEPPPFDYAIFDLGIPCLGICLGAQMQAHHLGVEVRPSPEREFGQHSFHVQRNHPVLNDCPVNFLVTQSHGDRIEPDLRLTSLGSTENSPVAAFEAGHHVGVQFHPEVESTEFGDRIFSGFCFGMCQAQDRFPAEQVALQKVREIRNKIGDSNIVIAISGGSDSATCAYLIKLAVESRPNKVRGVYVKGLDRADDERHVIEFFGNQSWMDLVIVDVTEQFLERLHGKTTMREKRPAMQGVYDEVLNYHATAIEAGWIVQGTLFTDLSESGKGYTSGARKAVIKHHHNVNNQFVVPALEPLSDCVKDTGRNVGRAIGVPEVLLVRHPFPGPGAAVRIDGEVTRENLALHRRLDEIYIEELRTWNLYHSVWQAGVGVTGLAHTCQKGDDGVSGVVIMLWAVWSVNGFTAEWARLDPDFLDHVSRRMTNEVNEVGAVVYRISNKPPTTIEMG